MSAGTRHNLVSLRRLAFHVFHRILDAPQTFHITTLHVRTTSLSATFQVCQLVRVATRYLHLQTAFGSSWAHWMFGCCVLDCFSCVSASHACAMFLRDGTSTV